MRTTAAVTMTLIILATIYGVPAAQEKAVEPNTVTAIDIVLEPDAAMRRKRRSLTSGCARLTPRASLWTSYIDRISLA